MQEIDIDQAATALEHGAVFIDVREPAEYVEGHLPGAVNLPMGQLMDRTSEIDPTRPVHVVCASGNRSSAMTDALTAAGFDAINVAGGTKDWIRSGRPTER